MMPPHVDSIDASDPSAIVIEGASLVYADPAEELRLVDVDSGDAVRFTAVVQERWRGDDRPDPPPGAIQVHCTITVRPSGLRPGRRYRLDYLGERAEFVA